jgi:hypothetical protein
MKENVRASKKLLLRGGYFYTKEQEIYHRAEKGAASYHKRGYPQIRERRPLY